MAYYYTANNSITIGGTDIVVDDTDAAAKKEIGYFSTVGLIKCVSYPKVSISGYSLDSTNLFTGSFLGIYDVSEERDKTEKVYSYNFSIYDENNKLFYSTGDIIHNASNYSEYWISTDTLIIDDFITNSNKVFKVEYSVTTLNHLIVKSPLYRITSE